MNMRITDIGTNGAALAEMAMRSHGMSTPDALISPDARRDLRDRIGEFVGGVFFTPLLQEMQKSPFKTRYSDGGRGGAAFAGQLSLELAKRAGRAAGDGFADRLIGSIGRRVER